MLKYANAKQETRALADNPKNQPVILLNKLNEYSFEDVIISGNIPQIPYHLRIIAYDEYFEPQIIVYCGHSEKFGWYYDVLSHEELKGARK